VIAALHNKKNNNNNQQQQQQAIALLSRQFLRPPIPFLVAIALSLFLFRNGNISGYCIIALLNNNNKRSPSSLGSFFALLFLC